MRCLGFDIEYDYKDPFLGTTAEEIDGKLISRVYGLKVLSQKREFKKLCENKDIRKVWHNASGDFFVLRCAGIEVVEPYECTLIASNLVDENYAPRNLKQLARIHLQEDTSAANRLKGTIKKYKEKAKKGGYQFNGVNCQMK